MPVAYSCGITTAMRLQAEGNSYLGRGLFIHARSAYLTQAFTKEGLAESALRHGYVTGRGRSLRQKAGQQPPRDGGSGS